MSVEYLLEAAGYFIVYCGHLRFQIAIAGVLWGLVLLSRQGRSLDPILGGMFDLTPKRAGAVAAGGGLLGLSLLSTVNLVLTHGPQRFGTAGPGGGRLDLGIFSPQWWAVVFAAIAGVPLVWILVRLVRRASDRPRAALWVCGGTALAVGVAQLGVRSTPILATWAAGLPWFHWNPRGFGTLDGGDMVALHPGHGAALGAALVTGILYLAAGAWTGWRIKFLPRTTVEGARTLPIPALGWVMALLILLTWSLGGIAFLLDGLGISSLLAGGVALAAYYGVAKYGWIERHTYHVYPREKGVRKAVQPAELLRAKWREEGSPVAIVCASGGGIHAAAWCAHLLEELAAKVPRFRERVALTSSVSGGSVGCFYFHAAQSAPLPPGGLFAMAASSSLDFAAWGFAFRDLLRYLIPVGDWFKAGNRSWALERAWRRFDLPGAAAGLAGRLDVKLEDWERETQEGRRPGAVFNATLVETGERFPIATVELGRKSFLDLYPEYTLRACTAANLSAAFPLVSPAAAPWARPPSRISEAKRFHLVDGGYYDNYGIVSALDFLERGLHGLSAEERRGKTVVILRIEGHEDPGKEANPGTGLCFQLAAPLQTMFGMRSSSQRARNELELELATERWRAQGVAIETVALRYPHPGAPLSWHLTDKEKEAILAAGREAGKELDRVSDLLRNGSCVRG